MWGVEGVGVGRGSSEVQGTEDRRRMSGWQPPNQPRVQWPLLKLTSANGVNPKKPSSVGNPMLSLNCEHEEDGARKVRGALSVSMVN